jgi:hypothetical protein
MERFGGLWTLKYDQPALFVASDYLGLRVQR